MRTLAEYRELDRDMIQAGYIDWMLEKNALMARLFVKEVAGNGLKYNVKSSRGNSAWTEPNDTITSTSGGTTQRSAYVYSLIKQCDVDKSQQAANSTQDPTNIEIKDSAEDMMYEWTERMIHGRTTTSTSTKQPKGLFTLIADIEAEGTADLDAPNNSQVIAGHATSAALTLDMMDELTDAVVDPNCYALNKRMRRKMNSLARAAGNNLTHDRDELGYMVQMYGGLPLYIVDAIESSYPDSSSSVLDLSSYAIGTTRASGNDNSVIFCLRTGEDGFAIMQTAPLRREGPWTPDDLDADRYRFVWYNGFCLLDKFSAAVLTGVLDTAL